MLAATRYTTPLPGEAIQILLTSTPAGRHAGVDLYLEGGYHAEPINVLLITNGKCIYAGNSHGYHPGQQAKVTHRQPDGAEIVRVYGNLSSLSDLQVGGNYPPGATHRHDRKQAECSQDASLCHCLPIHLGKIPG